MAEDRPAPRASDADRERAAELLRGAAGEGRLTVDELDERLQTAYDALTRPDLDALTSDLVDPEEAARPRMPVRRGEGGTSWIVSVLGGHDRKGRWRVAARCTVINLLGGSDLDLNDAELADDIVELRVFSMMGGADIHVPEGLDVEVSEVAVMGGNRVELGEERPSRSGPLLRVRMVSVMGGSDLHRGRKLSRRERKRLKREGRDRRS